MPLTLVVPGLLDLPAVALSSIDAHAPAWSRLLASGAPPVSETDGALAAACRACGLERQDDWPVAPKLARAQGIDPGADYWLCAEPATLAVSAADVRLASLVADLSPEHAQALLATLNRHFAVDGLTFVGTPETWFVRATRAQRLATRPPEAALGAPMVALLPSGADAPRWRRWQNEAQMLLFEHPANVERERAGGAPVNSVWLWGGGTDVPAQRADAVVFACVPRVVALARGSKVEVRAPPESLDAVASAETAAVWLDEVGPDGAERTLAAIERAWMAPAERALDAARITGIEIVVAGRDRALRFRPSRGSLTRRWRARLSPPRGARLLAAAAKEAAPI